MLLITFSDVDECALSNGGCTDVCKNLIGSFYCACSTGYDLSQDGRSCIDIDECTTGSNDCSELETCINSVGSFHCFPAVGSYLFGFVFHFLLVTVHHDCLVPY